MSRFEDVPLYDDDPEAWWEDVEEEEALDEEDELWWDDGDEVLEDIPSPPFTAEDWY